MDWDRLATKESGTVQIAVSVAQAIFLDRSEQPEYHHPIICIKRETGRDLRQKRGVITLAIQICPSWRVLPLGGETAKVILSHTGMA